MAASISVVFLMLIAFLMCSSIVQSTTSPAPSPSPVFRRPISAPSPSKTFSPKSAPSPATVKSPPSPPPSTLSSPPPSTAPSPASSISIPPSMAPGPAENGAAANTFVFAGSVAIAVVAAVLVI